MNLGGYAISLPPVAVNDGYGCLFADITTKMLYFLRKIMRKNIAMGFNLQQLSMFCGLLPKIGNEFGLK